MIGVVIPAHDEEAYIGACLASVRQAAASPALAGEPVEIVVALDRCNDMTASIVAAHGALGVTVREGNVGRARAAGVELAIARGARWVACTDADSRVPADWLCGQLAGGHDAFCGMVDVGDWGDYDAAVHAAFADRHTAADDHPHVHGANLGFSAALYQRCGGFAPLPAHEDVVLVEAMARVGARIARRARPTVITSARRHARARGGFSDYLRTLEAQVCTVEPGSVHAAPAALLLATPWAVRVDAA